MASLGDESKDLVTWGRSYGTISRAARRWLGSRGVAAAMLDDDLLEILDSVLEPLGAKSQEGEDFREPPLDILRYYLRRVRLGAIPIVGRGLAVTAVVRQPVDVGLIGRGYRALLNRLSGAVTGRFPPIVRGHGVSIGLTVVVLTPEPIGPDDDTLLSQALMDLPRARPVPLGVLRVNLGQEACAFALREGPEGLFPEPGKIADAFSEKLRRFAPRFDIDL